MSLCFCSQNGRIVVMAKTAVKSKLDRWLPYILIIAGIVGVIAAYVITADKIELLKNPNFKPSCSLNPVLSCGSVMQSAQAHVFGFDNPFIGLIGYPILVVTGVVLLG